jgi:hypothetical protein
MMRERGVLCLLSPPPSLLPRSSFTSRVFEIDIDARTLTAIEYPGFCCCVRRRTKTWSFDEVRAVHSTCALHARSL